ncbi:MAG: AAA family ATPase, partial [Bacteroidales bacterium]|nr:AAA family ATPase [Bacteroidales bacterium]
MRKRFNVTGSCNPERHYMVDSAKRFAAVEALIDQGEYFTINRARQYGKTTTLDMIWRRLSNRYLVMPISFEGMGDSAYDSEAAFSKAFVGRLERRLEGLDCTTESAGVLRDAAPKSYDELSILITRLCKASKRPIVLTIDEVDKSSDNQLFLNFLGMLRNKYLDRSIDGMDITFHSVVLAGVYDVKNLKLRLRPDEERKYNSPWNIAADFNVDMTFHPDEIAQMLADYEADNHTGMDINAISHEIYKYTSGYPFLVSYICKTIDERLNRQWNETSIVKTVKLLAQGGSTLMDDLAKNLEN